MDGVTSGGRSTGVSVTIDRAKIEHVNTLLSSLPDKALTVYERAIQRGVQGGRVQGEKEIRQRYDIPLSSLRDKHSYYTFRENVRRDDGGVVGYINFAGAAIPLFRFHPSPKTRKYTSRFVNGISGWRITTEVSAADIREKGLVKRSTAFIATMQSGHEGIFTRYGKEGGKLGETASGKAKIREMFGPNVQTMLDYQPAREAVQERMREIVEKRIDHELLRTLEELR